MCHHFDGEGPKTGGDDKCSVCGKDEITKINILLALEDKVLFNLHIADIIAKDS